MSRAANPVHELLTSQERELYELSQSDAALAKLSGAQRRAQLQRARALRDRVRSMYRRQVGHTLHNTATKRGYSGLANERTRQKAAVLSQVVDKLAGTDAAA